MENSIEEDIKIVDNFVTYFNRNIQKGYKADLTVLGEEIEAIEHILSDYKRVLKENEYMHNELNKQETTINKYAKENEELKEDRKNNNEMIALAQNKILNYMRGYEDGKKHKMTAVAQGVENQQYYIVQKQMEKYEELIKRLQKENEQLRTEVNSLKKDISNMYDEEVIISIISDNFNLSRNEVLKLLGGE